MKGFGIEIKNNLLDPKHVENMGESVWLYMWLIDHITSVTEEGVGIVLGGRPIKFEEVQKDLGKSQNTYTRWIAKLTAYPYVITRRTPQGIVFKVLKAHKRFGKRFTKNGDSLKSKSDSPQTGRDSPKSGMQYKTLQDNNKDNVCLTLKDWNERQNSPIAHFKPENIVKKHGAEKVQGLIKVYGRQNGGFRLFLEALQK